MYITNKYLINYVFIIFTIGCSFVQQSKKCGSDICNRSVCTNYPDAVCYPDVCADCSPRYFIGNNEVTNDCGRFIFLYNKL